METIRGIAVFPGVAIGPALVLDTEGLRIPRHYIAFNVVPQEITRLDACLAHLSGEIEQNARTVADRLGPDVAMIFEAHRRMITDPHLREMVVNLIEREHFSAEYAVRKVLS